MTKRFLAPIGLANISADPTGLSGAFYYNTSANTLKYYNGSTWGTLQDLSTAQTITGVKTFSTTPVIDVINAASATGTTQSLFPNTSTGTINIGGSALTTGTINIGTAGTGVNPIVLGKSTSTITFNGTLATVNGVLYATGNVGIGQTPVFKLDINGGTLGTTSGNQIQVLRLNSNDGNAASLEITETRTAAGSSWTTSGFRLQQKIDATWMAWQQFTTDVNNSGISWGTGTTTVSPTSISEKMRLDSSGNLTVVSGTISGLAAAGTATTSSQVGYMGIPQNATTTGAATLALTDNGTHLYSTATRTITVPGNTTGTGPVAFPIGASIALVAASGATVTIQMQATATDTIILAGPGTSITGGSGTRTLAPFGMATLLKVTATSWMISGNGLT